MANYIQNKATFNDMLLRVADSDIVQNIEGIKSYIYSSMSALLYNEKGRIVINETNKKLIRKIAITSGRLFRGERTNQQIYDLIRQYGEMISQYEQVLKDLGYDETFDPDSISNIPAVLAVNKWSMNELGGRADTMTTDIRKTFNDSMYRGQRFDKLTESIGGKYTQEDDGTHSYRGGLLNRNKSYAYTIANTGLMSADRTIGDTLYRSLNIQWFEYEGAENEIIIRPFCQAILKGKNPNSNGVMPYGQKAKTYKKWFVGLKPLLLHEGYIHYTEIQALKNNQLPNTFKTGGGYNCRHEWQPAPMSTNRQLIKDNPELDKKYKKTVKNENEKIRDGLK